MKKDLNSALENLKGGHFGISEIIDDFKDENYYLVKVEIADPVEKWEICEYHLLDKNLSKSQHIATADGYNGVEWHFNADAISQMVDFEQLSYYVHPYDITGDLLSAAIYDTLDEADENYQGKCKIWVKYCYSSGTYNAPNDGFLKDESGEDLIFDNYPSAEEYINEMETGIYYLSHGEMGAPSYTIVKYDD